MFCSISESCFFCIRLNYWAWVVVLTFPLDCEYIDFHWEKKILWKKNHRFHINANVNIFFWYPEFWFEACFCVKKRVCNFEKWFLFFNSQAPEFWSFSLQNTDRMMITCLRAYFMLNKRKWHVSLSNHFDSMANVWRNNDKRFRELL